MNCQKVTAGFEPVIQSLCVCISTGRINRAIEGVFENQIIGFLWLTLQEISREESKVRQGFVFLPGIRQSTLGKIQTRSFEAGFSPCGGIVSAPTSGYEDTRFGIQVLLLHPVNQSRSRFPFVPWRVFVCVAFFPVRLHDSFNELSFLFQMSSKPVEKGQPHPVGPPSWTGCHYIHR